MISIFRTDVLITNSRSIISKLYLFGCLVMKRGVIDIHSHGKRIALRGESKVSPSMKRSMSSL